MLKWRIIYKNECKLCGINTDLLKFFEYSFQEGTLKCEICPENTYCYGGA